MKTLQRSVEQQYEYTILLNCILKCFIKMVNIILCCCCCCFFHKKNMIEHDTWVHNKFHLLTVIFKKVCLIVWKTEKLSIVFVKLHSEHSFSKHVGMPPTLPLSPWAGLESMLNAKLCHTDIKVRPREVWIGGPQFNRDITVSKFANILGPWQLHMSPVWEVMQWLFSMGKSVIKIE